MVRIAYSIQALWLDALAYASTAPYHLTVEIKLFS